MPFTGTTIPKLPPGLQMLHGAMIPVHIMKRNGTGISLRSGLNLSEEGLKKASVRIFKEVFELMKKYS